MVMTSPGHGPTGAVPVITAALGRTGIPLAAGGAALGIVEVGEGIGGRCPAASVEGGIAPAVTAAK